MERKSKEMESSADIIWKMAANSGLLTNSIDTRLLLFCYFAEQGHGPVTHKHIACYAKPYGLLEPFLAPGKKIIIIKAAEGARRKKHKKGKDKK